MSELVAVEEKKTLHCKDCGAELDPAEFVKNFYCKTCEEVRDEGDLTKKYECSSCGEEFTRENSADGDSNRCPQCNKFGAIQSENVCNDCEEECEETETQECGECGTVNTREQSEQAKAAVETDEPRTKKVKFPYKKGQEFKLKAPYQHIDPFKVSPEVNMGKRPLIAQLASFNKVEQPKRAKELGFTKYAEMEISEMLDHNSLGSHHVAMTLEEVLEHFEPITYQEMRDLVVSFRTCENCGKQGADYRVHVLADFKKPTLSSGEPRETDRYLCDECKEEATRITKPIHEALYKARHEARMAALKERGVPCDK